MRAESIWEAMDAPRGLGSCYNASVAAHDVFGGLLNHCAPVRFGLDALLRRDVIDEKRKVGYLQLDAFEVIIQAPL